MNSVSRNRQKGFTLIEVLIAVLVLSIGLLGLAGLQTLGLRNNSSAYLRSQATILAYDMADRMRANMAGVRAGNYNVPNAAENTACESASGNCDAATLAAHDAQRWNEALARELPGGQGVVCIDSDPNDGESPGLADHGCDDTGATYAVKIWWNDSRDESRGGRPNATQCDGSASTQQCFVMSFRP